MDDELVFYRSENQKDKHSVKKKILTINQDK